MNETFSLRAEGIEKRYAGPGKRVEVLAGVDLALDAGEALAITGPSGSGKSTLLHIIGTLDPPSAGRLQIGEADPFALAQADLARFRNREIGFVFQDHYLLPHLSVLENVLLPTLVRERATDGEAPQRARKLLERVGLGHRLGHRPAELSGGERQRAAVARALVNAPRLVLCDEPTGSLDHHNAQGIGDLLVELHDQSASILIVVTHSSELASRFARRVAIEDGRLRSLEP